MTFVAPPGYQPVYNPSIPYLGPIYGGLREGSSIYIQGSIPEDITRFHVNLLCGQSDTNDIALHCNPRFDGWDKVVFNTRQNDCWDSEDKIRSMPFCKGERFEMVIMVTSQGYQIRVNGKDFHMFPHRIPVERVGGLQIAGDVAVQNINIIGVGMGGGMGGGYPGMGGGYPGGNMGGGYPGDNMGGGYPGSNIGGGYPGSALPGMGGQPVYNPPVPYQGMIPGGLFPKRTIIIRGMMPYGGNRMAINFVISRTQDIAFHLNPRISEGIVVRNSMIGGGWGNEERELNFNPFAEGQYFDMSIRCGNQRFKVFVNGQHLFDFFHRMQSFNEIDQLQIDGDVQISYIHF
ncbi:galectin-4-like [Boleophthalmus pectinirostris]|uniref:galectin-4-like n=1 Tax=Boleophthalmus pectinirostris TaxID=150288 RepID=UPI00242BB33F|nr:galectin-4-like [Boleophthalmus pectinirostris]